jgi:predicted AAA+ superfamily ATPase
MKNILYFNFEDERLRPFEHGLGNEVLDAFYELNPQAKIEGAYLFLDEVQEVPDWGIWLRRVVDTEKVTLYVTGSSAKILSADVATEFRGRSITSELLPFGYREYVRFHEMGQGMRQGDGSLVLSNCLVEPSPCPTPLIASEIESLSSFRQIVLNQHFKDYLLRGGFPAVQKEDDERATGLLQLYAQQVVARDVIERHNLSNPQVVSAFARQALAYNGRELSLRKSEDRLRSLGLKTSRNSLSESLSYFEDAFLLASVLPFSRALADDPKVSAKVYAIDPGLARANAPAPSEDLGQLFECAAYLELRRNNPHRRERYINSYKTKTGFEIDFIVGDALSEAGFELYQACLSVKNEQSFARETRALRKAMSETCCNTSTILTLEDKEQTLNYEEGTIRVIPLWKFSLIK